jgi:hypothetical protein
MKIIKSVAAYRQLIKKKTELQIAELLLADLIGYRQTSLKRANDIDTICNLILAIKEQEGTIL